MTSRTPVVAVTIALACAMALAGCAQSSNSRSTGAGGATAPTASTTTTPTTPTTPTTTTSTTPSPPSTGSGALTASPTTGSPRSVINFSFVPPAATGVQGHDEVSAALSVVGPQKAGCIGAHHEPLSSLPLAQRATVSVGPAQLGGDWCPGTYTARVEIVARPKCAPGMMCPQFIRMVATLGPATFRIAG
jgi:hypothetical protein